MYKKDITKMYADIAHRYGSFGDGVDHGAYNPYDVVGNPHLSPFERTGVSVAILTYLMGAIDNSTYESAVVDQGPLVREVLSKGFLDHQPLIRLAVETFFESETRFVEALKQVFEQVVKPAIDG